MFTWLTGGGTLPVMPRTARAIEAGLVYHVLNRGNGRMRLFHKDEDFAAYERVLGQESLEVSLGFRDRMVLPQARPDRIIDRPDELPGAIPG
ncbi:MAG: hypothetical protein IID40_08795 [Planctomycetes bacterium]|nr:hypothetical protein [Planctomycetota bacterium]